MDIDLIKSRILEFLRAENITSAQFAQEIGVQPSGISHIISGRNKPSLDFIVKMLLRYPALSTDWLLFGKGAMFREGSGIDLFMNQAEKMDPGFKTLSDRQPESPGKLQTKMGREQFRPEATLDEKLPQRSTASRIVIFNADGTFSEHFPE